MVSCVSFARILQHWAHQYSVYVTNLGICQSWCIKTKEVCYRYWMSHLEISVSRILHPNKHLHCNFFSFSFFYLTNYIMKKWNIYVQETSIFFLVLNDLSATIFYSSIQWPSLVFRKKTVKIFGNFPGNNFRPSWEFSEYQLRASVKNLLVSPSVQRNSIADVI